MVSLKSDILVIFVYVGLKNNYEYTVGISTDFPTSAYMHSVYEKG